MLGCVVLLYLPFSRALFCHSFSVDIDECKHDNEPFPHDFVQSLCRYGATDHTDVVFRVADLEGGTPDNVNVVFCFRYL